MSPTILAEGEGYYSRWSIRRYEPFLGRRLVAVTVGRDSIELDPADPADRRQLADMVAALTSVLNGGA